MRLWACRGCDAKDGEVAFLRERVKELESQMAAQADAKAEIARLRALKPGAGPGPQQFGSRPARHLAFANTLYGAGHMRAAAARSAVPRSAAMRPKEK